MNESTTWLDLGERALAAGSATGAVKVLVESIPSDALTRIGLARLGGAALRTGLVPMAGAFAVGAVAGAGAVLFFAPGSERMREAIRNEIDKARARAVEVEADAEKSLGEMREKVVSLASRKRAHDDVVANAAPTAEAPSARPAARSTKSPKARAARA